MYELVLDSYDWDKKNMDSILKTIGVKSNSITRCMKVVSLNDTDYYTFVLKDDRFFTIGLNADGKTPMLHRTSWMKI